MQLWYEHEKSKKQTYTRPIIVELDLKEWKDIGLKASNFLIEIEKEAK